MVKCESLRINMLQTTHGKISKFSRNRGWKKITSLKHRDLSCFLIMQYLVVLNKILKKIALDTEGFNESSSVVTCTLYHAAT